MGNKEVLPIGVVHCEKPPATEILDQNPSLEWPSRMIIHIGGKMNKLSDTAPPFEWDCRVIARNEFFF